MYLWMRSRSTLQHNGAGSGDFPPCSLGICRETIAEATRSSKNYSFRPIGLRSARYEDSRYGGRARRQKVGVG